MFIDFDFLEINEMDALFFSLFWFLVLNLLFFVLNFYDRLEYVDPCFNTSALFLLFMIWILSEIPRKVFSSLKATDGKTSGQPLKPTQSRKKLALGKRIFDCTCFFHSLGCNRLFVSHIFML